MVTNSQVSASIAEMSRRWRYDANNSTPTCQQRVPLVRAISGNYGDCRRLVYDLAGTTAHRHAGTLTWALAARQRVAHGRPAQPPSPTTIDVASLVINITLNTSRRQAKTPIWDRS